MTILLKHHIQQHNTMKINQHFAAFAVAAALASCGTTDTEPPTVCDSDNLTGLPSILAGELEVEAGTTVTIHDAFCDNDGLAEIRWNLHTAEGHAHEEEEEGEEHEGEEHEEEFILWSGGDFEKLEIRAVEGTKTEEQFTVDLPLTSRGLWDLLVSIVDAEGNAADDVLLQLHIENDHLPLFELSMVGGVNPAEWEGEEQVWAPGATVNVTGSVSDSDGVAEAELLLIRESDEAVVWSAEIPVAGESVIDFSIDVVVPADAVEGEYHFEMEAVDGAGVDMHTGFHLEVE
jgi:hypothetical protein